MSTSLTRGSSSSKHASLADRTASWKAVRPARFRTARSVAGRRARAHSTCLCVTACISGVFPSQFRLLALAPASRRTCRHDRFPYWVAATRAVSPFFIARSMLAPLASRALRARTASRAAATQIIGSEPCLSSVRVSADIPASSAQRTRLPSPQMQLLVRTTPCASAAEQRAVPRRAWRQLSWGRCTCGPARASQPRPRSVAATWLAAVSHASCGRAARWSSTLASPSRDSNRRPHNTLPGHAHSLGHRYSRMYGPDRG